MAHFGWSEKSLGLDGFGAIMDVESSKHSSWKNILENKQEKSTCRFSQNSPWSQQSQIQLGNGLVFHMESERMKHFTANSSVCAIYFRCFEIEWVRV